jgi:hypothetical protein
LAITIKKPENSMSLPNGKVPLELNIIAWIG